MVEQKIGIFGASGRMGQMIARAVEEAAGLTLSAGLCQPGSKAEGKDIGIWSGLDPLGIAFSSSVEAVADASDVIIDFTPHMAFQKNAQIIAETETPWVCGTTGLSEADMQLLKSVAEKAPIVWSANMSLGVILLEALVKAAARALPESFDIEILEMHHSAKRDAPSGTALLLGEAAAAGRGSTLEELRDPPRDGLSEARKAGHIGLAALRGGDVVGEHSVYLAGKGERLELTHRAMDRMIFARGAVKAAAWLKDKPNGLYHMRDVLGLSSFEV